MRYAGLSDVPSGNAEAAQTLNDAHSLPPMINLQLPYSLVERQIEVEHVTMAQSLGLGITAWSPLGGGFLSGKYSAGLAGEGRVGIPGASGLSLSDRDWALLEPLADIAGKLGVP